MENSRRTLNLSKISIEEVAPCGVLCFSCPSLLKKTCNGCRSEKIQKRKSKFACKIRKCCLGEKKFELCFECKELPCKKFYEKLLKTHNDDPRYTYRRDTLEHCKLFKKVGSKKAIEILDQRWRCSECGGRILMYHYSCFKCGRNYIEELQDYKVEEE
ncbi:MAG: DUF3795 domain-containing protein [Candidatus Lokiarchaeota archaeon]|nr:DUF3795 domain-containing protein [Candidatus Lokiarchaeota archaeon]